ncbi:MAG TPA: 50S ribosomal protein L25 [Firmicutes bacterium]|jgi:large subunit ribosomal protein L25|nr:50S ribosomal protein L25 [Bacillota bacterium]HHT43796.1 50S ribosomal protein L25 [Bacillota bacterium]
MANYQLTVEERTQTGKSYARKLRAAGKTPGVVYGYGQSATQIEAETREVERAIASTGSLIDLKFADGKKTVIVKDVHRDPVKGQLWHVDFHEVDLTKKLEVTVPLRIVGEDERESDGGVVQTHLWELQVLCLPTDIPASIDVDVSSLAVDEFLTIGQLQLPEGVEALGDPEEMVVKIALPTQAAADTAEEADEEQGEQAAEEGEAE